MNMTRTPHTVKYCKENELYQYGFPCKGWYIFFENHIWEQEVEDIRGPYASREEASWSATHFRGTPNEIPAKICLECRRYPADYPSNLCSGCLEYRNHQV
jgi:hypothetical protein